MTTEKKLQTTEEVSEKLFSLIEKEIGKPKYHVDAFVQENSYEVGKIIHKQVQNVNFIRNNLVFPVVVKQVLPYMDDEFYIPTLLEIIKHEGLDNRISFIVIQKLSWRAEESKEAIPYLERYLERTDNLRDLAAISLAEIGYEDFDKLLPSLISGLQKAAFYTTRMKAARLMLLHRDRLQEYLPSLIKALEEDKDYRFRQKIARYFGEINVPKAKAALQKVLKKEPHPIVRMVAKTSLGDLEKLAES
ncbi:MAG: HEAT repeat domain-containing protein [Candidatus Heimdallarchaeota archaeon]